jgi:hypothetical protein
VVLEHSGLVGGPIAAHVRAHHEPPLLDKQRRDSMPGRSRPRVPVHEQHRSPAAGIANPQRHLTHVDPFIVEALEHTNELRVSLLRTTHALVIPPETRALSAAGVCGIGEQGRRPWRPQTVSAATSRLSQMMTTHVQSFTAHPPEMAAMVYATTNCLPSRKAVRWVT